jgi:thiamine-phosphate pyrophosphorylase
VNSYEELLSITKDAVRFGVDIVQLRDKSGTARDVLAFAREAVRIINKHILFIVNDRADIAELSGADGVHVGQDDLSLTDARRLLGPDAIIGVSCQTWEQARRAEDEGADYIGFGSVFTTKTKPGRLPMDPALLKKVLEGIRIPVFPIGGITAGNIERVTALGATRAAVCRDLCLAEDRPAMMRRFKDILTEKG